MTLPGALLLAALLQVQAPATGAIRGSVLAEVGGSLAPLSFAMVEVVTPTGARAVVSNGEGHYLIQGVPAEQPLRLRGIYVGHEETRLEVTVAAGSTITVDLVLSRKPVELPPLFVNGSVTVPPVPERTATPEQQEARAEMTLRALDASTGMVEAGIGDAVRRAPGNDPTDPSDVLFMRGSTTDMKLVLLDGAPVYTPFHLGGLLRSFDEKVLGSATHHVGGAPARYDGGLSYILDLRTRAPARDRLRSSGAVDLMSAAASLEAPVTRRAGVLFSSRALHGLQSRLAGGAASPYGYLDGLARGEVDLAAGHQLSLTAFGNEESVRLSLPPGVQPAKELTAEALRTRRPDAASWSNAAFSATYRATWDKTAFDLNASTSRYRADLPVPLPSDTSQTDGSAGADSRKAALLATGATQRTRVSADAVHAGDSGALRFGAAVDHSRMSLAARRFSPVTGAGAEEYDRSADGWVLGAYVDGTRRVAPSLTVRSGLRVDRFAPGGTRGALRLSLLWSLTEEALLTIAGGRYHQLVRTTDADMEPLVGDAVTAGTGGATQQVEKFPLFSVASADHVLLSLDQRLAPGLRLTTEGFYKRFSGLDGLSRQDLNASGIDLRVLSTGGRMTGWLGYSLSWFWNDPDALGRAEEFTGRHLLSAGLNGRVAGPWGVDLAVAYSDGLPLTSIPFGRSSADAAQELAGPTPTGSTTDGRGLTTRATDTFLRVDVEVFADLTPTWRGRTVALRPYLRILNALDKRDGLFYYFEPWRDPELTPLAELSVIPVLGLEWRF